MDKMSRILICVVFLSALNLIEGFVKIGENNTSVTLCAGRTAEMLFGKEEIVHFVFQNRDYDYLPFYLDNPTVIVNVSAPNIKFTFGKNIIIQANDHQSCKFILKHVEKYIRIMRVINPKILVISTKKDLVKIIMTLWDYDFIYAIAVLYDVGNGDGSLFTANPQDAGNNCGTAVNVFHEQSCINEFLINTIPKPLRSYGQCPVTITRMLDFRFTGPDLVSAYSATVNMLNKTFGVAVNNKISLSSKITVGAMRKFYNLKGTSKVSKVYDRDIWVWVVPIPDRITPLEIFLIIFSTEIWIMVFVGFLITLLTQYFIMRFLQRNKLEFGNLLLGILSMTLFGIYNRLPKMTALRFLLLAYTVYCVHIQTAYTSNLIRVQTIPQYKKGIENFEELVESPFPVFIHKFIKNLYFTPEDAAIYKKIDKTLNFELEERSLLIEQIITTNNFSAPFSLQELKNWQAYKHFVLPNKLVLNVSVTGKIEDIFCTFKGDYFIDTLNKVIDILTENGIYEKHKSDTDHFHNKFIKGMSNEPAATILTLGHLYGIFVILGTGFTISIIVFIIELFVGRKR